MSWQLFVLSPYVDIAAVLGALKGGGSNHLLCAHLLTPGEKQLLQKSDPALRIELMREFATDMELQELDESIHKKLLSFGKEADAEELVQIAHTTLYLKGIKHIRNKFVAQKYRERYGVPTRLFVCSGPNVDAAAWREIFNGVKLVNLPNLTNTSAIDREVTRPTFPRDFAGQAVAVTSFNGLKRTRVINDEMFLGNCIEVSALRKEVVRRAACAISDFFKILPKMIGFRSQQLRLRKLALVAPNVQFQNDIESYLGWRTWASMAACWLAMLAAKRGGVKLLISSMHLFSPIYARAARMAGIPVMVVQDGYLPPNYPGGLYYQYRGASMVWWSDTSREWGESAGLFGYTVRPRFESNPRALRQIAASPIVRVLAPMNHGGEWTTLIWRSDVDLFVQGIIEAACQLPNVKFKVRLHPTASSDMHDGINIKERIFQLIEQAGVNNVSLSTGTLADDIEWADFAVSEYSLTLAEFSAIKPGRVGVFNPTGRRNFFIEFTNKGLPYAENIDELVGIIRAAKDGGEDAFAEMLSEDENDLFTVLRRYGVTPIV